MSTFIKIAWRNIVRNRARSLITIWAVGMGLTCLIFLKGFVDGADRQMVENYTDLFIGHVQIHRPGFQDNMSLEKSIINPEAVTAILEKSVYAAAFSRRVKDYALISSAEGSSGVLLLGIDPNAEKKITKLHERIRKGKNLETADDTKIVIGEKLAANLKVDLGDKVVIMSQGADGSMAAAAYEVKGLLDAGSDEIDKGLALITLKAARDLLVLDGKVSEFVIKADSLEAVDNLGAELKGKLNLNKFEILDWKEISPATYQWLQFDQVFTYLILAIVLLVVASGILNTILMGVLERTREFGIMLALGTKPSQIIFMVVGESFLLGSIGIIFGSSLGIGLNAFFGQRGIDLSGISSALNNFYIGSVIYTRLDYISVAIYGVIILFISIAVSLFPAVKASRLEPIDAIRSI